MSLLILFLCLLGLPLTSGDVSKIHDELIWQKEGPSYSSFKLDFPWKFFKIRENRVIQTLASLEDSIANSINGPTAANLTQLAHSDANLPPSSFEIKLLTNDVPLEAASLVARCKVCMALASTIWSAGVEFIHHYLRPPTMEEIMSYSEDICEVEIPVTILKEWVLLKAKIAQPQGSSGSYRSKKGDNGGAMWSDFFLMSQRHRQHATSREIGVIEFTCEKRLVTEHNEPSVLLTTVDMLLQRYHTHLMQRIDRPAVVAYKQELEKELTEKKRQLTMLLQQQQQQQQEVVEGEGEGEMEEEMETLKQQQEQDDNNDDALIHNTSSSSSLSNAEDNSNNVIDDYADPPSLFLDRSCTDLHPQCEYWAKYGECTANPRYMVKSPTGGAGHCEKACKTCRPKTRANAVETGKLLKEATDVKQLESVSNDLLIELYNKACVQTDSCAWATGDGQHSLLTGNSHFSGSNNNNNNADDDDDNNKADFILQTPFIRRASPTAPDSTSLQDEDPSTTTTTTTTPDLSQVLKLTKVTVTRPITEAVLSESKSLGIHSSPPEPIADTNNAGQLLWYALGNKCIYVSMGFWVYETCGWRGVTQFHLSDTKESDWVILLGNWKATVWEVEVKRDSVFYDEGSEVPCITQYLEDGNECEVDDGEGEEEEGMEEEEEEGGGGGGRRRIIKRSGVLHLMCSPDEFMHMAVKEPRKCFYNVEVALPELCKAGGLHHVQERAEEEDGEIGGDGEVRDEL